MTFTLIKKCLSINSPVLLYIRVEEEEVSLEEQTIIMEVGSNT